MAVDPQTRNNGNEDDKPDLSILQNSKEAKKALFTPFGRKFGIYMDDPNGYSLYRIKFADSKGGEVPADISGRWTTRAAAENDLNAYLHKIWLVADKKKEQESKPLSASVTNSMTYTPKNSDAKSKPASNVQ